MAFESMKCPICGKSFVPYPQHSLTDGRRRYVCSPGCSTEAWNRNNERKNRVEQKIEENKKKSNKAYKERAKQKKAETEKRIVAKPVYICTNDGKIAKRFPSIAAASRYTGYDENRIRSICRGTSKLDDDLGYTFKFDDSENALPVAPYTKPVIQYTLDGEFVARYESVGEAAKAVGCRVNNISQCCIGTQKTAKKFIFKYESEEEYEN